MYYRIFSKIYEIAAKKMCVKYQGFIQDGSKILDLGCGSGVVGKAFQEFFKAEIVGVDIIDRRIFPLPFQIIDGKSLPFPENSFDVVLISHVLHHAKDPELLLEEAKRVTKDKILISEDLAEGFLGSLICKIHGNSFNCFYQKNKGGAKFLNNQAWKESFNNLRLSLVFEKKVSSFLNPVQKKLFVLEKT